MTTQENFYGLNIAPILVEKIDKLGFKIPTPIQRKAIPIGIEGKDIIGIAQTGTGKTLAFCIPMLQRLAQKKGKGLVLVPTRELAGQVNEVFIKFAPALNMKTCVLIGGAPMGPQMANLRRNPRVIIATPGRLLDHMMQKRVRLDDACVVVLDEADRMLDMGFAPQIEQVLKTVPKDRQTMLFSATMPSKIIAMVQTHMHLPVRTEIVPSGTAAENISQEMFVVKRDLKDRLLLKILEQYSGAVLLFTRTKMGAGKVRQFLKKSNHSAAEIHSDRSLRQRTEALDGFKSGRYRILVATDIAARGIDVKGIELVINYDLPEDPENYVHRIGRTGRAGQEGHAISIATPEQGSDVRNIEKLIKTSISLSDHPEIPTEKLSSSGTTSFRRRSGSFQRGGRSGGGGRYPSSARRVRRG
ncbi:MAG: DEAD/DEAH box helicase [Candidatus Omnitrophica bacterium]|nr:DEAD/DEAH box helicase [Candidatus Omnitrophota bacterium]